MITAPGTGFAQTATASQPDLAFGLPEWDKPSWQPADFRLDFASWRQFSFALGQTSVCPVLTGRDVSTPRLLIVTEGSATAVETVGLHAFS
jgi:hypothetical protein